MTHAVTRRSKLCHLLAVLAVAIVASTLTALEEPTTGTAAAAEEIFVDHKCQRCHSVERRDGTKEISAPRTRGYVLKRGTAGWSQEQIEKLLEERRDGRGTRHTVPWTGTSDELRSLTRWLLDETGS